MNPNLRWLAAGAALCLAAIACNVSAGGPPTPSPTAPDEPTLPELTAAPAATETPAATPILVGPPDMWSSFMSSADEVWMLDPAGAYLRDLPFQLGQFYDYAPAQDTILYATTFADHGAGPGNLAVSDLYTLELGSGVTTPIVNSQTVVEALWMPNGTDILYLLATDTTYELRLRTTAGDDRLLASDLAPTFAPSPTGQYVAFTRETGYEVPGAAGLYVVDVATGAITMVSDVDRGGQGSIDDQPVWSWDETYLMLTHFSGPGSAPDLSSRDGSGHAMLSYAPELADQEWFDPLFFTILVEPDNRHVVALSNATPPGGGMGGPSYLVRLEIDPGTYTVVAGELLGESLAVLQWQVPGESFWALSPDTGGPTLVTIP